MIVRINANISKSITHRKALQHFQSVCPVFICMYCVFMTIIVYCLTKNMCSVLYQNVAQTNRQL